MQDKKKLYVTAYHKAIDKNCVVHSNKVFYLCLTFIDPTYKKVYLVKFDIYNFFINFFHNQAMVILSFSQSFLGTC